MTLIQKIAVFALPVLFAITVHEAAHGWMADRLGDSTARRLGRLSLNPLRHIDPVGTVLLPLLTLWIGGLVFGWAKPVPVAASHLRRPRRDMALVAIAGPASNLLMGIGWALVTRLAVHYHAVLGALTTPMIYMSLAGITINTILLVLNLLPLPPLDGGRVLVSLLPPRAAIAVARVEPFGLLILIALIAPPLHLLAALLSPPVGLVDGALRAIAGISR